MRQALDGGLKRLVAEIHFRRAVGRRNLHIEDVRFYLFPSPTVNDRNIFLTFHDLFPSNKLAFHFLTNSTSNMINIIRSLILFIIFNLSLYKLLNTVNNSKKFLLCLISTISQAIYYKLRKYFNLAF